MSDDMLVEVQEYKGYRIRIEYDDYDAGNPRDWDNIGTLALTRNCYGAEEELKSGRDFFEVLAERYWEDLPEYGTYDPEDPEDYGFYRVYGNRKIVEDDWSEILKERVDKTHIILPVYKYEHSGVAYNTGGFSCPWDSGQAGFIYCSIKKAKEEYGWKRINKDRVSKIEESLRSEIETFSNWANGSVYGYIIEDEGGEEIDDGSCWGFYGYDYESNGLLESAREVVDYHLRYVKEEKLKENKQRFEKVKTLIRNRVDMEVRSDILEGLPLHNHNNLEETI